MEKFSAVSIVEIMLGERASEIFAFFSASSRASAICFKPSSICVFADSSVVLVEEIVISPLVISPAAVSFPDSSFDCRLLRSETSIPAWVSILLAACFTPSAVAISISTLLSLILASSYFGTICKAACMAVIPALACSFAVLSSPSIVLIKALACP